MANKDFIHSVVRAALEKDNWIITDDPYTLVYLRSQVYVDFRAEKAALDGKQIAIVIEVKSFRGRSNVYEFHAALGQYIGYRNALQSTGDNLPLYLALTQTAYEEIFDEDFIRMNAMKEHLALLIVDEAKEEILQWITL